MTLLEPVLQDHPFFADIEQHHVHIMAEHATTVSFDAGQLIFRQGEAAQQFYIIIEGQVALEVFSPELGPLPVLTLHDGDVLGWSWLFEPAVWHFDARALNVTRAIALDGAELRARCDENHELGYHLMKHSVQIVTQRLQATLIQLLDMYSIRR